MMADDSARQRDFPLATSEVHTQTKGYLRYADPRSRTCGFSGEPVRFRGAAECGSSLVGVAHAGATGKEPGSPAFQATGAVFPAVAVQATSDSGQDRPIAAAAVRWIPVSSWQRRGPSVCVFH